MSTARLFPNVSWIRDRVLDQRYTLLSILSVLIGIILWELYTMGQPNYLFPSVFRIQETFVEQVYEYDLLGRLARSMFSIVVGFTLAAILGVALGLAMGIFEELDVMLNPYLNALYVSPVAALVPVIIIIGGSSFASRVFVIFLFAVLEITIDTYEGVSSTPDELIEASQAFGASRLFIWRHVIFPHDLPYIFTGFRLGIGRAIKGMILAELIIDFQNLGLVIREYQEVFSIAGVLSVVLLLMGVGIVLTELMKVARSFAIPWEERGESQ